MFDVKEPGFLNNGLSRPLARIGLNPYWCEQVGQPGERQGRRTLVYSVKTWLLIRFERLVQRASLVMPNPCNFAHSACLGSDIPRGWASSRRRPHPQLPWPKCSLIPNAAANQLKLNIAKVAALRLVKAAAQPG